MEVDSRVLFAAVLFVTIVGYQCHPAYLNYIPNGHNVKDPCNSNIEWKKVGHLSLNPKVQYKNKFGLDYKNASNFVANSQIWAEICGLDSDNDGRSNGLELGDANCDWPVKNAGGEVFHPGFNEAEYIQQNCPPTTSTSTTQSTTTTTKSNTTTTTPTTTTTTTPTTTTTATTTTKA